MSQQILVPDIGDFKDVEVIDVLVKVGDVIAVDASLVTVETEKATMDVPSSAAGKVTKVLVKKGDRVSKGTAVVEVEAGAAQAAASAPKSEPTKTEPTKTEPAKEAPKAAAPVAPAPASVAPVATTSTASVSPSVSFANAHASPSVRKFARELGADLNKVKGSGEKGRITQEDVKAWIKQALQSGAGALGGGSLPKVIEVDFAKFGAVEVKPLGRIQKISGPRLHASWVNLPHVWQMDEADITELEEARNGLKAYAAKQGIKLTPLVFVMRAVVKTLQQYPQFNTSLSADGQSLVHKKYIHLGFAADTPNGLVVPVVRDADRKDIYELAADLATLSEKARDGKLSGADMQGGTFTISSLGGIGGTAFTPIINAPEVAILGVSKSSMKPVYQNGKFEPRLILPFTLAYDHRVIDGALGARFTTYLAQRLADVKTLLEAVP
jgi:pyruvate dehydrogenase E2 component (dihydrolipoamide acetyltransferase)